MHGTSTTGGGTRAPTRDLRFAAVAFTAGAAAIHLGPALPTVTALAAASLPALLPWRGRRVAALVVLGALWSALQIGQALEDRWPASRHASDHLLRGFVDGVPERGDRVTRFRFRPQERPRDRPPDWQFPTAIRVGWYDDAPRLRGGECWSLELRVRTPRGSHNPGGFDYEGWLLVQGLGATATVRNGSPCGEAGGWRPALHRWRQRVMDRVETLVASPAAAALAGALTVGDRSGFRDADWDAFRRTGTTHLVAVSGFNVAIVSVAAFWLFRALASLWPAACLRVPAQRIGLLAAALCAGAYAFMAGLEPPVQRAALMLWVLCIANWTGRDAVASRTLAAAWWVVVGLDPLAIASPGLWLSFAAVAVIFYATMGRLRAPRLFSAALRVQLVLSVALAPLTLAWFDGASVAAPTVNLVAVPLFAVVTPWVFAALGLSAISFDAGGALMAPAAALLASFHDALAIIAALDGLWLASSPPGSALALAGLGLLLLFVPRGLPLARLGVLCLLPMCLPAQARLPGSMTLSVLDVGQGLSVVVRTPHHALLYDAGPAWPEGFDAGASVVAPFLLRSGLREVDRFLLSHGDRDHAGGWAAVRQRVAVRDRIGITPQDACRAGRSWQWDGVRFEVLHPDGLAWTGNDASCVLRVSGPFTVLLPGDIEARAESELVRRHGDALRADVLVSPHHGSATSSSPAFVRAVRPRVVIHAAGWRHHYGHPRPSVVSRWAASGARQFVTGVHGRIRVRRVAEGRLAVDRWREAHRRPWSAPPVP